MAANASRRLRADAERNREAILRAALTVFETDGIYAPTDKIATVAGLGNATLYRNFPTRNDLLAALIEDRIDELLLESTRLERNMSADDALREWLFLLAWQLRIWHDLPACIAAAVDDATSPVQDVPTRLRHRTGAFLRHARDDGTASSAVTNDELFELITAVSWGIDHFGDDSERARRRIALATAGVFHNG